MQGGQMTEQREGGLGKEIGAKIQNPKTNSEPTHDFMPKGKSATRGSGEPHN